MLACGSSSDDGKHVPSDIRPARAHYGAAFVGTDPPVSLAEAVRSGEGAWLVQGQIDAVCQAKGCWMVLREQTQTVRVVMKDHAFSVPMDCKGKQAIVEGVLSSKTFSEAQVKHLEADRGGNPDQVNGTRTEYVLTATGVDISG